MKDQLSALIDGELDFANAEHVIKAAKSGGELKNCWAHYHLIGDVMRNELHSSHDFSARVMTALENEPIVFAPNANTNAKADVSVGAASRAPLYNSKVNNSKVWSIAASVAAVMFVGVMVLQLNQTEELVPVEIAQSVPTEYLQAHQAAAPNGAAYYIQNASFAEPK